MSKVYKLSADVRHEYADAYGSIVTVELKAGDVSPVTEEQLVTVAHLVEAGLVSEASDKSTKKKADPAADVTSEE